MIKQSNHRGSGNFQGLILRYVRTCCGWVIVFLLMSMMGCAGNGTKDPVPPVKNTLHDVRSDTLLRRAEAAKAQGRYAEAYDLLKRHTTIAVKQQRHYKQYATMVAILIGVLALMGLFLTWYVACQWKKTQQKNRVLALQIKEAIINKERRDEPMKASLDDMSPEELFHYIELEVSRRQLFLNPLFDRQMIMNEFHISKERVGAAFSQGSKYDSLPQFVSDLRLEYASKLLVTTDLPINDITAKAGFSNVSVFSRCFSRKFMISPTQYRRANSECI